MSIVLLETKNNRPLNKSKLRYRDSYIKKVSKRMILPQYTSIYLIAQSIFSNDISFENKI